jgi:hypothetical protein
MLVKNLTCVCRLQLCYGFVSTLSTILVGSWKCHFWVEKTFYNWKWHFQLQNVIEHSWNHSWKPQFLYERKYDIFVELFSFSNERHYWPFEPIELGLRKKSFSFVTFATCYRSILKSAQLLFWLIFWRFWHNVLMIFQKCGLLLWKK